MKKFFVGFILLLILGGAAFFLGWAQFSVPPGSWGLMRSKTHGVDGELIREGEFRWVWYKLIPTNVKILVFSPRRINRTLTSRGELPSGKVYAGLAGINADFSWEVSADLSFDIKPASLPALAVQRNITGPEDFQTFTGELADEVQAFTLGRLRFYGETGELLFPTASGSLEALKRDINGQFPGIENLSILVRSARFPDFALYHSVRQLYEDYLEKQREYLGAELGREAGNRLGSRLHFDELEKYGELLTKYPILLRYLAMESGYTGPGLEENLPGPSAGD